MNERVDRTRGPAADTFATIGLPNRHVPDGRTLH